MVTFNSLLPSVYFEWLSKMIISIEGITLFLFILFESNLGVSNWKLSCPKLFEHTFKGYVPRGNLSSGTKTCKRVFLRFIAFSSISGTFSLIEGVTDLKPCVLKCCDDEKCNVAFMNNKKCYHIACVSNDLCVPTLHEDPEVGKNVFMILVKPVDEDDSWEEILSSQGILRIIQM